MSVYVMPTSPADPCEHEYKDATGFRVDRHGVLVVWGAHGKTLAMWAPGRWAGAYR